MKLKTLTATLFALICGASSVYAIEPQVGSGETDGYKLVWQDLFDGNELNLVRWDIEVNGDGGGNSELQYYTDRESNVRVGKDDAGNGCLILTARRENYLGKAFTSGRITTKNRIAFKHGKVEAAIRMPKTANGLWPAFWMMGNDFDQVGWPRCGETDICEFGHQNAFSKGTQDRYFNGACHWGPNWQTHCEYARDKTNSYSLQDGEFHLFTCIWDENSIAMYVDLDKYPNQQPYYKMDIPDNQPNTDTWPGNYFHKENFILFNLAVGGNFPGIWNAAGISALNDQNGQQQSMYVNYLKIYQKGTPDESSFFVDPGDPKDASGLDELVADVPFKICVSGKMAFSPGANRIEVFDLCGRCVISVAADSISLENLTTGTYIIRALSAEGRNASVKISI